MSERRLHQFSVLRGVPGWLRNKVGGGLMQAFGIQLDTMTDRMRDGILLRFPGVLTDETLGHISRDRRIKRGPGEDAATFAARLRLWWDSHRTRGGGHTLLEQLHAFLGTQAREAHLVYHSGTRYILSDDGTIIRDSIAWGADGTDDWAQVWLFFPLAGEPEIELATWNDNNGGTVGATGLSDPDGGTDAFRVDFSANPDSGVTGPAGAGALEVDEPAVLRGWFRRPSGSTGDFRFYNISLEEQSFTVGDQWKLIEVPFIAPNVSHNFFAIRKNSAQDPDSIEVYDTRVVRMSEDVATAIPREWNAAHVRPINVVLIWSEPTYEVELWGYPEGTWADDDPVAGQVWPPEDPSIFVAE